MLEVLLCIACVELFYCSAPVVLVLNFTLKFEVLCILLCKPRLFEGIHESLYIKRGDAEGGLYIKLKRRK